MKVVALSEVQGEHFSEPTIIIAENVGGMEDIPVRSPKSYVNQHHSHCSWRLTGGIGLAIVQCRTRRCPIEIQ